MLGHLVETARWRSLFARGNLEKKKPLLHPIAPMQDKHSPGE
jgi:hypothetical protein